jgi:AGZA family xanthine/uracil permease-like MFS transporter
MARTDSDVVRVDGGGGGGLDRYFRISERGSTVRTEIMAGVTTFLTMAYILFVNPAILGFASAPDLQPLGLPFDQVLTVTALVAGIATIAMGVYANYPFAIAAGLGLNAFVAFSLVVGRGLSFPEAMGVVVVEGLIITVLVLTNVRELIMNAIPLDLKRAIGIGIGLFLVIIGLQGAGVVVDSPATLVTLSPDLTTLRTLVFGVGLVLTFVLVARGVRGGLLLSIVATTVFAVVLNEVWGDGALWETGAATIPDKIVSTPDFGLVGDFSFGFFSSLGIASAFAVVLAVMLSDFFDTMGTAVSLADEAGLLREDGTLPDAKKVLVVDSLAAAAGGAASASSNTTFIESASGIAEGGRTGLTSVVVGLLFLGCLFISPLAGVIPPEATAPVLIVVGYLMMRAVGDIAWRDPAIGIPALLTIALMPFTYSITNGVGAGFLAFVVIKVSQGRARDVHWLLYVIAGVFAWYFLNGDIA